MPIKVIPSDPSWPQKYEEERALLAKAIGKWVVGGIHHVGGTAVAGVSAEPVIDILIGTDGRLGARDCGVGLDDLGYEPRSHRNDQIRRFYKPCSDNCAYDLRLAPVGSPYHRDEIAFRDLLRSNPQVAFGYSWLKRDLARRHGGDRHRYTAAKIELIQAVLLAAELP